MERFTDDTASDALINGDYRPLFAENEQVGAWWDELDLASLDWYDREGSAMQALFVLCEILRGYESPEWGNTGGRYGHRGGYLTGDDWDALARGEYVADEGEESWETYAYNAAVRGLTDADQHLTLDGMIALADFLYEHCG